MKRLAFTVLAAGWLVASVAYAGEPEGARYPSDEALRHYLAGRWLEETGDLDAAGAEYSRASSLDPGDVDILLRAAEVASRNGQASRALELARQAEARESGNARARWLEGAALFSLQRPTEALAPLREAVAADSTEVEFARTLAHVAESTGDVALVDSCYDRVVRLDPDDGEAWFQLATTRARLGRFAEADSALTVAIEDNPDRPGMLFMRGWLAERLGRPAEAIGYYRHHLEVHPDDQPTRRRLVQLLAQANQVPEALQNARLVAKAQPADPTAFAALADLEFRAGRAADAERSLASMRALAPGDPDLAARTGEVLLRNDRDQEAVRFVDDWVRAHPGAGNGLRMRGWVRAAAGQPDSAVSYARLEAVQAPDSLGPHLALARFLREARRWPEAVAEAEWLCRHSPGDAGLLMDLGFCRDMAGDVTGAIAAGRDALAAAPDAAQVQNFLGYLLADHDRDLEEAARLIRSAIAQDPDNGAYIDSMGWVLYRQGQLAEARAQLEHAAKLVGADPVVHEHLGDVYRDLKLTEMARAQYRMSLAADRSNQRVHNKLDSIH